MHMALENDDLPLEYLDMRDVGDGHMSAVMSALQFQHKLFTREMKGELLPGALPLQDMQVVLDFICGPGSWCMDWKHLVSRY